MLGVSASSLRRYRTRARPTPAVIAARLHVLALVIADLAGGFDPDGDAAAVRKLSSALAGAGAT